MFGPKQMALELEAARLIRLAAKIRHALDQMADDALESITP